MMHQQNSRLLLLCLVSSILLGGIGCTDSDFEDFSEITKLRILGISASTPEVAPGETVTFEAVTATPEQFPQVFYRWQICILTDGPDAFYACSENPGGSNDESFPINNVLAEGTGATIEFTQDLLSAEDLVETCVLLAQAADIELPDFVDLPVCRSGFPVTVRYEACAGEEPPCADPEIAFRETTLLFDELAEREDRNENPIANGILVNDEEVRLDGTSSFEANRDREIKLTALINEDQSQTFLPVDRFSSSERRVVFEEEEDGEVLYAVWATTGGSTDRDGYYSPDGRAPLEELQTTVLSFDEEDLTEPRTITIWMILRDQREGLSAISRTFEVRPFRQ